MSDSVDEEIVDSVIQFIGNDDKSDKKIDWITQMVEWENENPDRSGWNPSTNINMPPYYIGQIKSVKFVNVHLDSNNNTILYLSDKDSVEHALDIAKEIPDKHSKEWIEDTVAESSLNAVLSDIDISEEDIDNIDNIVNGVDGLEYWSKYISPGLKYRDTAKKAALIMLASPEDKYGSKGRINVLIYGPPGTGKTVIKKWLVEEFDAQSIDGPRVSKVDLTYNKNTEQYGQLPKAHKGIIVIEEADEMDEAPLGSALTSLGESGMVEIQEKKIPAEVRGVMLGNFETREEIIRHWSPESLNRFDFLIKFDMLSEDEKNETLDFHYKYFRKPSPHENDELFKKYLALIRQFEPEIDELKEIKEYKEQEIHRIDNIREGISVMNVAWTIARINLEDVKLEHYKQAIDLVCRDRNVLSEHYSSD